MKSEIIKLLEGRDDDVEIVKEVPSAPTNDEDNVDTEARETGNIWYNCKDCEYKTKVKEHSISHKMAHTGQYKCQQGCKELFKTLRNLDDHHKAKHPSEPTIEFQCELCNSRFATKQHLNKHTMTKHQNPNSNQESKVNCELWG